MASSGNIATPAWHHWCFAIVNLLTPIWLGNDSFMFYYLIGGWTRVKDVFWNKNGFLRGRSIKLRHLDLSDKNTDQYARVVFHPACNLQS